MEQDFPLEMRMYVTLPQCQHTGALCSAIIHCDYQLTNKRLNKWELASSTLRPTS